MSDTLTYVAEMTLAAATPAVPTTIGIAQPDIVAQLAGLVAAMAALNLSPPSLTGDITTAGQIVASLELAAGIGVVVPSLSVQLAILAAMKASLQASLDLLLGFRSLLAAAGIHVYSYDGSGAGLGPQVTAALADGLPGGGGGGEHINALILATSIGATWTAMGGILKTS
jgi:hypothetical protein